MIDLKNLYEEILKIRLFEENLLDLYSKGHVKGTTHTCIGQEINSAILNFYKNSEDIIVSNHRSHGHFISHTNNIDSLFREILGLNKGICNGYGGSQHLNFSDTFYSNGVLGGTLPLAAGIAFYHKFNKTNRKVFCFLGDGVFGEGNIYEAFNIIKLFDLPITIIVEKNNIAQSTNTEDVISNEIKDRALGFNIFTDYINDFDLKNFINKFQEFFNKLKNEKINSSLLVIESLRLSSHSKGDDTRSDTEIEKINKLDFLGQFEKHIDEKTIKNIRNTVNKQIEDLNTLLENEENFSSDLIDFQDKKEFKVQNHNIIKSKKVSDLINEDLCKFYSINKDVLVIGEDIKDPYGGAFKISKGLSSIDPKRCLQFPISESSMVGFAGGLALNGIFPIVEIMFADFLTLTCDSIINYLSKFRGMYGNKVTCPVLIRTPAGGYRGYGATHSQSLEKIYLGIHGLNLFYFNPFIPYMNYLNYSKSSKDPTLLIENKVGYNIYLENSKDSIIKYREYLFKNLYLFPYTLSVASNGSEVDFTFICNSSQLDTALNCMNKLFEEFELFSELIIISNLNNSSMKYVQKSITSKKVICLEETCGGNDFFSELAYYIFKIDRQIDIDIIRSMDSVIPSNFQLEKKVLISEEDIMKKIEENYL